MKQFITPSGLFRSLMTCVVCLGLFGQAHAQEVKIGYVDAQRLLQSAPAKAAEEKIAQEFSKREKDNQDLGLKLKSLAEKYDKDAPVLSETDRIKKQRELLDMDQDLKRRRQIFNEDLNQRKSEELANFSVRVRKAVKQIAESEKYDIVLQEEPIYFNPRIDLTEKVLKALSK
ncbi:OmpH family outer membrane protein [Undibacterium sp. TJN25]|uniref:OmpH family outer membrane protein n=1 Tax=Undibacterium sp. TJN25 TaxID=3413056 RepID=UPI003BF41EAA